MTTNTFNAPPNGVNAPIVHKINDFYKAFYQLKKIIPKSDRYGLYLKTEESILESLQLAITAAFSDRNRKIEILQELKIKIELTKRLIRLMMELNIVTTKKYLFLETDLQEISKMATSWHKYCLNKES